MEGELVVCSPLVAERTALKRNLLAQRGCKHIATSKADLLTHPQLVSLVCSTCIHLVDPRHLTEEADSVCSIIAGVSVKRPSQPRLHPQFGTGFTVRWPQSSRGHSPMMQRSNHHCMLELPNSIQHTHTHTHTHTNSDKIDDQPRTHLTFVRWQLTAPKIPLTVPEAKLYDSLKQMCSQLSYVAYATYIHTHKHTHTHTHIHAHTHTSSSLHFLLAKTTSMLRKTAEAYFQPCCALEQLL